MRLFSKRLILLLAFSLGISQAAMASPDRDRDRDGDQGQTTNTPPRAYSNGGGDLAPGNCSLGRAEKDLDVNNVLARAFNTGSLFFGNTTDDGSGYVVPQASGNSAIFASGLWVGGKVNGEVRVAGSRYSDFEFWPGPLNNDGTLPDPNNCSQYDAIYKVTRADIQLYEASGNAATDLANWPAELGAPVIAAPGNGVDDDGDGLTDEGTDGIDNDGDELVDERDEQERRIDGGYDLAAGDRPEIIGDQGLWWVMNDVGNVHAQTESDPLGVEVQVLAFAFARADALGETTFYRYRVINKNVVAIEEAYLSFFSDPDLGDAADDYIGADTTLSLGIVYNGDEDDAVYGIPPAVGYDFFQGPIVDLDGDGVRTDTLGLTRYTYFTNAGGSATSDPSTREEYYNHMQGLWNDGTPMTEGGAGYQTEGAVTKFAFPGDPVAGDFWSEVSEGNAPGDRRFVVHTGPFTLEPLVPQDIVFGIVYGQGGSALESVDALRASDQIAQAAYDVDFELAQPPPAPPACVADDGDGVAEAAGDFGAEFGSGACAEAVERDGAATLVWGYPSSSENYLGQYVEENLLLASTGGDLTYEFEGFNVYSYPTSGFAEDQRQLVATFDKVNGIQLVRDERFDPVVGVNVPYVAARGTDSGLQYFLELEGLTNFTDYYYGISAYAYIDNELAIGSRILESPTTKLTVRPSQIAAGNGGSFIQGTAGDVIIADRLQGDGSGAIAINVVDPTALVDATYRIEPVILDVDGSEVLSFRVLRNGTEVLNGATVYDDGNGPVLDIEDTNFVLDGLQFLSFSAPFPGDSDNRPDFSGDGEGFIEVSYAGSDDTCPDPNDTDGLGCEVFEGLGNTVWHNGNINDDYYVSGGGGDGSIVRLRRYAPAAVPDDFEMRFTEACATVNSCFGLYGFTGADEIVSVPFELWNIGDRDNPDDDVRMIPFINNNGDPLADWADQYTGTDPWADSPCEGGCPMTDWVYWMMPDRPNGYDLFAQAAAGFGGGGAIYDRANDGDTMPSPDPFNGGDCGTDGVYVNYCYRNDVLIDDADFYGAGSAPGSSFVYPIGRTVIADLAQDGTTPPAGTLIQFNTSKPLLANNDVFEFSTSDIAFVTNDAMTAQEALDLIGIVPNPYMGTSAYETGNLERIARFTNMPEQATVRVYTVSGTLVKTLTKDGPSRSLDWNLTTDNNLPVASGMYLIHVDVPGVGERVLKFGVIQRRTRITVF